MAETARLLGVSVYRRRTMLSSSSSSLVLFTVSLYWVRLPCRAPGPKDEHPAARAKATTHAIHVSPPATRLIRTASRRRRLAPRTPPDPVYPGTAIAIKRLPPREPARRRGRGVSTSHANVPES